MIEFEYSPAYYEEIAATKEVSVTQWRSDVAKTHLEAERNAQALSLYHKGIRVVVDGSGEYAITCDDCRLWAHFSRKLWQRRDTVDDASGSLLEVVDCNVQNLHKIFGAQILRDVNEAWDQYTSWDFDPVFDWDHLAGYTKHRGVKGNHWRESKEVWIDEEPTEEQGSRDWLDRIVPNRRSGD